MPDGAFVRSRLGALVLYALPPVAWAAVIFGVSSVPGPALQAAELPAQRALALGYHFVAYLVLAALVLRGLLFWRSRQMETPATLRQGHVLAAVAVIIASLYAVSDEVHQAFVPGRAADPLDVVVDTLGAITGVALMRGWAAWKSRRAGAQAARPRSPAAWR